MRRSTSEDLLKRVENREAKIAVFGLGYVGLPISVLFAKVGFHVVGVDVRKERVEALSKGLTPWKEKGLNKLLGEALETGNLELTLNPDYAGETCDVFIVAVQTPVDKNGNPDLSFVSSVCRTISRHLGGGKLLIVESTLPPGCSRGFLIPLIERLSGLKCGRDFWYAYCPERVLPGKLIEEYVNNPSIIGAFDDTSGKLAKALYRKVKKGELYITKVEVAEVVKVAENTFRDVNIALANELALICEQLGVDVEEVIKLANTHPRVSLHKPGCGVGGACLPKDPFLLLSPVRNRLKTPFSVIASARGLNEYMPLHTVELVCNLAEPGCNVLVLGLAYKGNVNDTRESPGVKIACKLEKRGFKVKTYDPVVEGNEDEKVVKEMLKKLFRWAKVVVVATDHEVFKRCIPEVLSELKGKVLVDGRLLVDPKQAVKEGVTYVGIGRSLRHAS